MGRTVRMASTGAATMIALTSSIANMDTGSRVGALSCAPLASTRGWEMHRASTLTGIIGARVAAQFRRNRDSRFAIRLPARSDTRIPIPDGVERLNPGVGCGRPAGAGVRQHPAAAEDRSARCDASVRGGIRAERDMLAAFGGAGRTMTCPSPKNSSRASVAWSGSPETGSRMFDAIKMHLMRPGASSATRQVHASLVPQS